MCGSNRNPTAAGTAAGGPPGWRQKGNGEGRPAPPAARSALVLAEQALLAKAKHQNSNPASRAASATAATRPWYRFPPRSKTTLFTPAALARSATSRPTVAAAALLPVGPP